jgi:hypothetical protein
MRLLFLSMNTQSLKDVSLRGDRSGKHTLMHWFSNEGTFTLAPEFTELVALLKTGATWRAS